jgi:hypothetical protein
MQYISAAIKIAILLWGAWFLFSRISEVLSPRLKPKKLRDLNIDIDRTKLPSSELNYSIYVTNDFRDEDFRKMIPFYGFIIEKGRNKFKEVYLCLVKDGEGECNLWDAVEGTFNIYDKNRKEIVDEKGMNLNIMTEEKKQEIAKFFE